MTPAILQALSPAAPAATSRQAAPAAPGEAPASFAAVLDGTVQALSGEAQAESCVQAMVTLETSEEGGGDASLVQADSEATLVGEQPRLDALALMLAAAPAPPGQTPPAAAATAATSGAGTTAAVSARLPVAAQARPAFDGSAAPMLRPMAADAPVAHPNDSHRATAAAAAPGSAEPAAADVVRAAVAAPSAALRREAHAAPAQSRQVPAIAAADHVNGTDTEANPRPAAAATASATTPSIVAGKRDPADVAPATLGKAGPLAASLATPAAAQRLSADPEGGPAAASATRALQPGPIAAQDASPAPAQAAATDLAGPGVAIAAASASASPGAVAHLAPPVGSPDWAPALAQQLVRMPGGGAVELNLNPVELGPLQVKLSVVEGQAQVQFVAEHAAVRQALEAALPQLRASFAENGISLGQANVGAGAGEPRASQDGREQPETGGEREAQARADEPAAAAGPHRPGARAARIGAVDTFA